MGTAWGWGLLWGARQGRRQGTEPLDLGAVQPLTRLCSLMGRSAGTTTRPNGTGINFPALEGGL